MARYESETDGRVTNTTWEADMELGAFSVSLAVKDIEASKLFYEKTKALPALLALLLQIRMETRFW